MELERKLAELAAEGPKRDAALGKLTRANAATETVLASCEYELAQMRRAVTDIRIDKPPTPREVVSEGLAMRSPRPRLTRKLASL